MLGCRDLQGNATTPVTSTSAFNSTRSNSSDDSGDGRQDSASSCDDGTGADPVVVLRPVGIRGDLCHPVAPLLQRQRRAGRRNDDREGHPAVTSQGQNQEHGANNDGDPRVPDPRGRLRPVGYP